jgi:hypothetical protein
MTVTADDFATFLALDSVDTARAEYLIELATALCESVVSPLPAGSDAVVLDVVARVYVNPTSVTQDTVGPSAVGYSPGSGGLHLTRSNLRTLRRLAGYGGAFTIDVMPTTAGESLPEWGYADGSSSAAPGWMG